MGCDLPQEGDDTMSNKKMTKREKFEMLKTLSEVQANPMLTENGGLMTVTEVQKSCPELADLSNQRISALLRQLKDDKQVERVEDKRKAYFKAV